MTRLLDLSRQLATVIGLLFVCSGMPLLGTASETDEVNAYFLRLFSFPHAIEVSSARSEVKGHELALGSLKKVRGEWRFKHSERLSGTLTSYTWRIVDGFTAAELMSELEGELASDPAAEQLFSCAGRACGHSAQWASRVFQERLLYGRQDMQRYSIYRLKDDPERRLLMYSAVRSEDRQYLHMEVLDVEKETLGQG